ncbi:hypothetical protein V8F20_004013 [Naviculisporaceae sp. PSN 640]
MPLDPRSPQWSRLLSLAALFLLFTPSAFVQAQEAESNEEADASLYDSSYFTSSNYGSRRDGPFGISLSDWDSHFDSPNATHTVSLPIPDLTNPYSYRLLNESREPDPYSTGAGWNWTISLADGIPVPRGPNQDPGVTTGVQVNINFPENITEGDGIDDSWQLCVIRWHLRAGEGLSGEGTNSTTFARMGSSDSCNSALSRVCIRDLEAYAAGGPDSFGRCRCPDPMSFENCKGEWFPHWSVCEQTPYRAADIRKEWKDGSFPVFSYAGPPRDQDVDDNLMGYNATGHMAWPVMLVWGRLGGGDDAGTSTSTIRSLTSAIGTATGRVTPTSATRDLTSSLSSLSSLTTVTGSAIGTVSPVSTSTSTLTVELGSDIDSNNNKKRQNNDDDDNSSSSGGAGGSASSQAIAKLTCLAVREAEEGSVLPGRPVGKANAASHGKFAGDSTYLMIAVCGLVAGYMAFL